MVWMVDARCVFPEIVEIAAGDGDTH